MKIIVYPDKVTEIEGTPQELAAYVYEAQKLESNSKKTEKTKNPAIEELLDKCNTCNLVFSLGEDDIPKIMAIGRDKDGESFQSTVFGSMRSEDGQSQCSVGNTTHDD